MQVVLPAHQLAWGRAPRRWLICLDLQRDHVVPGRPRYAAANGEVAATCAAVLEIAREEGWRVVHSQLRGHGDLTKPREMFGAPIEGLRPLTTEPVFFRTGLSAFGNAAFADELRQARGQEVFLIGFSLADTCIATALAGVDEGLSLTLVEDAVGDGASPETAAAARLVLQSFVRISSSERLETLGLEAAS